MNIITLSNVEGDIFSEKKLNNEFLSFMFDGDIVGCYNKEKMDDKIEEGIGFVEEDRFGKLDENDLSVIKGFRDDVKKYYDRINNVVIWSVEYDVNVSLILDSE